MMRHLGAVALLVLISCSPSRQSGGPPPHQTMAIDANGYRMPPPEAYLREEDRERARTHRPGEVPCSRRRMDEGVWVSSSLPIDECVRMLPRQRFRGVWFNRFEVSVFWPDRSSIPDRERPMWLDVQRTPLRQARGERAYFLDFEGRRTMYEGSYGYGDYRHAILVDRVISITLLPE
jgi:hypothetical protein